MYRSSPKFRMSDGPPGQDAFPRLATSQPVCSQLCVMLSGCRFFQFVDQTWFDGVVALVIVLNLLLIVMEPLAVKSLWFLDSRLVALVRTGSAEAGRQCQSQAVLLVGYRDSAFLHRRVPGSLGLAPRGRRRICSNSGQMKQSSTATLRLNSIRNVADVSVHHSGKLGLDLKGQGSVAAQ